MRILIINSEYPPIGGGAGSASAYLSKTLSDLGQEVTVLTSGYDQLPQTAVHNDVSVRRIRTLRKRIDRSNAFEQALFLVTGSINGVSLVRKWKPDVILAFFGIPCGAVSWVIKLFTGVPYLVSLRGGDVPGFRPYDFSFYHRLISPFLHHIWHRAEAVVANSQGLQKLAEKYDDQVEIKVIPNGVDIHHYSNPEEREWIPTRMLFVGRLVYQKGLDLLMKALGELKDFSWQLRLVGDGPHRSELERLAKNLGISDRIEFKGWIDKEMVTREYQHANLFVFPSRHEGMPNAVLEAMASGLPVIASKISGNEELVNHGVTGLLVPPENFMELGRAVRSLLEDTEKMKKFGAESRSRVESNYTWESVAIEYLDLFQRIVR